MTDEGIVSDVCTSVYLFINTNTHTRTLILCKKSFDTLSVRATQILKKVTRQQLAKSSSTKWERHTRKERCRSDDETWRKKVVGL